MCLGIDRFERIRKGNPEFLFFGTEKATGGPRIDERRFKRLYGRIRPRKCNLTGFLLKRKGFMRAFIKYLKDNFFIERCIAIATIALFIISIYVILYAMLKPVNAHAACIENTEPYQAIDIATGRDLKVVCSSTSEFEAEGVLKKQQSEGCFIAKEQGQELYRVFCPYALAEELRS